MGRRITFKEGIGAARFDVRRVSAFWDGQNQPVACPVKAQKHAEGSGGSQRGPTARHKKNTLLPLKSCAEKWPDGATGSAAAPMAAERERQAQGCNG